MRGRVWWAEYVSEVESHRVVEKLSTAAKCVVRSSSAYRAKLHCIDRWCDSLPIFVGGLVFRKRLAKVLANDCKMSTQWTGGCSVVSTRTSASRLALLKG
jgi:hypothetical protein